MSKTMTKAEKRRVIYYACEQLNLGIDDYSCVALSSALSGHNYAYHGRLLNEYERFLNRICVMEGNFLPWQSIGIDERALFATEEKRDIRITLLLLFLEAGDSVLKGE